MFIRFRRLNLELSHTHPKLNRIVHFHRLFMNETTRNLQSSPFVSLWFLFHLLGLRGKMSCFGCSDFRLESEGSLSQPGSQRVEVKHLWESQIRNPRSNLTQVCLCKQQFALHEAARTVCWPMRVEWIRACREGKQKNCTAGARRRVNVAWHRNESQESDCRKWPRN